MDKQKYIQDSIDGLFTTWLRRTVVLGAFIFLFLSFLDFVVFREQFRLFFTFRVAIAGFLLLVYFLSKKIAGRKTQQALGLAAVIASSVTLEAMIILTGGDHSPYATGMILLAVVALSYLPAGVPFHATTAAVIYGTYIIPIIMTQRIDDAPTFITTNFFICSIIVSVLMFRYMSMRNIVSQLGTEYELITSSNLLQDAEERQRLLLQNANDAIYVHEASPEAPGRFLDANERASLMLGYTREEFLSMDVSRIESPEQVKRRSSIFLELQKTGSAVFQTEHLAKDGRRVPVEVSVRIFDLRGRQTILSVARDISERKKIEDELRRLSAEQKAILENISSGVFFLKKRVIKWANVKAAQMFGYTSGEIEEKDTSMFYPDMETFYRIGREAYPLLTQGNTFSTETQMKKKGRELIWCSVVGRAVNAGDPSQGSIWLLEDITGRKQIEEDLKKYRTELEQMVATRTEVLNGTIELLIQEDKERARAECELREKEAKMRAMLESFDGLIYICSRDSRIEFMNENLARRVGRDAVGELCYEVLNDRRTVCPWCVNDRVFDGEIVRYEIRSPRDGLWYHVVNTPIRYDEGQVSKLAMFVDITEKKAAEEMILKAQRTEAENLKLFSRRMIEVQEEERRAIACELHDEIGQSLTGLKLFVESMTESMPPEKEDSMRSIDASLGEILSFVRSMSINLRPAMLDDFGLISTFIWYFDRYRSQTGIFVDFVHTGSERRFDYQTEIALYRITQEALTNVARHACVRDVLVEFIIGQGEVRLRIKDEGAGFNTDDIARSGSGLSIMRERCRLLNGNFSLSSSREKGTEILIAIPFSQMENKQGVADDKYISH